MRIKLPPRKQGRYKQSVFDRLLAEAKDPAGGLLLVLAYAIPLTAAAILLTVLYQQVR